MTNVQRAINLDHYPGRFIILFPI